MSSPENVLIGSIDSSSKLWDVGYAILPRLISRNSVRRLEEYMLRKWRSGATSKGDAQVPETPAMYGDPVLDKLLEDLVPAVQRAAGRLLFPTYSYMRLYKQGDILAKHTDRAACEISLSLCVAADSSIPWPLWIEGKSGAAKIELASGDAVLYRGIDCPHWREKFQGTMAKQVFLHYVDQNGPYCSWRFDRRPELAHRTVPLAV